MALLYTSSSSLLLSPSSSKKPNNPIPLSRTPPLLSLSFSCKPPQNLRFPSSNYYKTQIPDPPHTQFLFLL
ncbi:hypothetical protein OIU77_027377 [Salix suchowensis]|uniref:Uncharacterized protein n=1 Tax=Salix suchowensis TaxID=1278906 RepID=A0ABQ9BPE1_9ROSI|nr:hypothetical protein OIU78_014065 [Salix suchowensis]KAJ6389009.1 hypothetical protein OIU77_027377 [Salix suchowensis]